MSQTKAQLVGGVGFSTADSLTVHNGLAVTGVVTATSFAGNISGDATGLTGSPNITVTNITASGNVTVGGTLTYEDVTNIDAIGIVTARSGINITGAGMTVTGISTFRGDVQVADKIIHLDDTNTAIRFPAADTFTVETGGSERIRVGAAGSVGIGSDDPKAALDVTGDQSAGYQAQFTNSSGSNRARIYVDGNGVALVSENFNNGFEIASNTARIYANGSERLRIDSSGNVLVAKTTTALTTAGSRLSSGFVSLSGDSSSTNLAANAGGALSLANVDSTDNNFSNIGGYNSNGLVVNQIDFINKSHSSRTGDIAFLTHNGTSLLERLRITSAGNIGINSTSPGFPLVVQADSSRNSIQIINAGSGTEEGRLYWYASDASTIRGAISGQENGLVFFAGGATERARIDTSGRMGLGVTSPDGTLTISATASNTPKIRLQSASTDNDAALSSYADATGTYIALGSNYYLNSSGNGAVFDTNDKSAAILFDGRSSGSLQFLTGNTGVAAEGMRLDSSGRLGLGTNSPSSFDADADNLVVGSGSGNNGITIYSGNDSLANLYFADGTSSAAEKYAGGLNYSHSTNNLAFFTNGGQTAMRIDSSQRVLIGASSGTGKFIVQDSSLPKIQSNYNGTKHLEMGVGGSGGGLSMTTGHFLTINHQPYANRGTDTNLTERFRIASSGQIGLGGANYGTSGQVITSNGSGSAPTWQDAGGGAWNLITTVTASNDTEVDLTGTSSTYDKYCIIARNVYSSSASGSYTQAQVINNGTVVSSTSYRTAARIMNSNSSTITGLNETSTGHFLVGRGGDATNEFSDFWIYFNSTHSGATNMHLFRGYSVGYATYTWNMDFATAVPLSVVNISGLRFTMDSGNIYGTFQLYGIS